MPALFIIFVLVLSVMWSNLTALVAIALRMDSNLSCMGGLPCPTEERVDVVEKPACEMEDHVHSSQRGHTMPRREPRCC
jgi:hypothetical protein